jgi:hypothetical protein
MYWKNPDCDPGESEDEYIARKREESDSATGIIFGAVNIFIFGLQAASIFGIFFFIGFVMSQKIWTDETSTLKIWGFTLIFTYLIFCIIYFFKGAIIGLRTKKRKLWILPWLICVTLCCVFPAFIIKSLVTGFFSPTEKQGLLFMGVSWGAFILFLFYLYGIYRFKTPGAPKILYWSYSLGLKASS